MNLILFSATDLVAPGRLLLTDARARHVQRILKARPGDEVRVGEIDGRIGRGRLLTVAGDRIELAVELYCSPPASLPLILLLALPRPKVLRRTLAAAVTMGVKQIFVFNAFRVEKSYWQSPRLEAVALRETVLEALAQAGDTLLPEIHLRSRFRPFVEDELPQLAAGRNALLFHPDARFPSLSRTPSLPALAAIGPEGGFIPFEISLLQQAGLRPVSFGPRILRVEQVVPALIGRFSA
jgi:RsmE family RNA methyltransferase